MSNYRPEVYGLVEGPADAPADVVQRALAVECPDCNVNVFIEHDESDPTGYVLKIAHDASCPWLAAQEVPDE